MTCNKMSGGLVHSACEDTLHYWKMRIVDYLKRTRKCCILNAVAWPAEDMKTGELLIETTYPLAAASGAPLHDGALHPPRSLSLCVSRSLISAGNHLLFLSAPFYCCCLTHIPSLLKSHPSLVILNSQTPMPFYVFFYMKMCTANIHFYFADNKAEMYRIYASDKFGIHIQTFWLYSTVLIFWLISLSCNLAFGSAETFVNLTYRL